MLHEVTIEKLYSLDDEGPLTQEEEFMKKVCESRQKHAKAKLLIMQFIGLIIDKSKQHQRQLIMPELDPNNTTVHDIFKVLNF